jgi:hypothetical protein
MIDSCQGKQCIWPFPASGLVEAGQQVVLQVSVYLDQTWSRKATLGEEDINGQLRFTMQLILADVLVLQTHGGKDTVS